MNRNQLRQENQAIQRGYETKYFPLVKTAIQSKVDEVISVVNKSGIQAAITYMNNHLANVKVTEVVQTMALEVGLRFARRQWMSLQIQKRSAKSVYQIIEEKGFGFNALWAEWIKRWLFDFIVTKITFSVFETTKDVLFTVLNKAIAEGWGVAETVKALDELPLSASQAARIVRTEITRAANAGTAAAAETFPFQQQKEWMSAHDSRVRGVDVDDHASHIGLDGTVIDYDDVFIDPRNGDQLRFPGDPLASAASTINCRCTVAITAKIGENGRLIPKQQFAGVKKLISVMEEKTREIISDLKADFTELRKSFKPHDLSAIYAKLEKLEEASSDLDELLRPVLEGRKLSETVLVELRQAKKTMIAQIKEVAESVSDNKDMGELVDAIRGIEIAPVYTPTIDFRPEVKTDSKEVISEVREIWGAMSAALAEVKERVERKREYVFTPSYDEDKNISEVKAKQI